MQIIITFQFLILGSMMIAPYHISHCKYHPHTVPLPLLWGPISKVTFKAMLVGMATIADTAGDPIAAVHAFLVASLEPSIRRVELLTAIIFLCLWFSFRVHFRLDKKKNSFQ